MRIFTHGASMGKKVLWAFAALLVPLAAMVILLPFVMNARTVSPRMTCISNLKQLAFAALAYSDDWDDRLPLGHTWMDSTSDYYVNESLLHCNEVKDRYPDRNDLYGYAFNSTLSSAKAWSFPTEVAQNKPLVYDSSNLARNASDPFISLPDPPRHRDIVNVVCFLDGRAKALTKERAKGLKP